MAMADLRSRFRGVDRIPAPSLWADIERRQPSSSAPAPSLARRGVIAAFALVIAIAAISLAVRAIDDGGGRRPVPQTTPQPIVPHENGQISYTLFRDSGEDIYAIMPDRSNQIQLTGQEGLDQDTSWSPDGTRIAFTSFRPPVEGSPPGIYLMNSDGTEPHRLVANGFGPSWSPSGSEVAFSRDEAGNVDIFVVNIDGSGLTRLTDDASRDVSPSWSPDGAHLAFVEGVGGSATGVLSVMNADGSDPQAILSGHVAGDPRWSPNGDKIVFESPRGPNPDGPTDIYVVQVDGGGLAALTDDSARDLSPAWSPDGTKIAFSSDRQGTRQIFVMNADGSGVIQVTSGPDPAVFPSWGTAVSGDLVDSSPTVVDPEVFVPPTRTVDGMVLLSVTFPDGSSAELSYTPSLDLAELGVRPYWAGCGGDFGFFHFDPYGTLYEGEPLQTWTGSNGQSVGLWPGVHGTGPSDHLIWHFGDWTVEKYEYRDAGGSTPEQLAACAEGLRATVTDDGWIVLDGPSGVRLARGFGPPGGPELEFGDLEPRRFVEIWPGPCGKDVAGATVIDGVSVDLSKDFASWCDPGGHMEIHVYFEPGSSFFRDVFDGLTVQEVSLANR
jgi:Tol biopolymer transport system component